jgi:hypothetical protein
MLGQKIDVSRGSKLVRKQWDTSLVVVMGQIRVQVARSLEGGGFLV